MCVRERERERKREREREHLLVSDIEDPLEFVVVRPPPLIVVLQQISQLVSEREWVSE